MEKATSIGEGMFRGCTNVTFSELPSGLTSVGFYSFGFCTKVRFSKLPSELTSISAGAFYCCINITISELPSGVTNIGIKAFFNCSKITSLKYKGTVYTSKSALITALTNNGVTVGEEVFDGTGLTA